ncbi:hypothetical protein MBLNU230_g4877t1 [Neophaeotheca triangularis]
MAAVSSPVSALSQLLADTQLGTKAHGWRTKWLRACELVWEHLSDCHRSLPKSQLDRFTELLCAEDKFSIARLVIPPLRDTEAQATNPQQQSILDATRELRRAFSEQEHATQADFDDALITAEREELMHAEMHRARVLLHQSGAFGHEQEQEIREWLESHPRMRGVSQRK